MRAHIVQERSKRPSRRDAARYNQFDNRLGSFAIECDNVLIYPFNNVVDQFFVILNRALPEPKHLFPGKSGVSQDSRLLICRPLMRYPVNWDPMA